MMKHGLRRILRMRLRLLAHGHIRSRYRRLQGKSILPTASSFVAILVTLFFLAPREAGANGLVIPIHAETTIAGELVSFDYYLPGTPSYPVPILVFAHDFQLGSSELHSWGMNVGMHGHVVIVPRLDNPPISSEIILGLFDWASEEARTEGTNLWSLPASIERLGVISHGASGVEALRSALEDEGIRFVLCLDYVDDPSAEGSEAASLIAEPVALLMAEPEECNSHGAGSTLYDHLGGPRLHLRVNEASFCDPELSARTTVFYRYTYALLGHLLQCNDHPIGWLGGEEAQEDPDIRDLWVDGIPLADCRFSDGDENGDENGALVSCGCTAGHSLGIPFGVTSIFYLLLLAASQRRTIGRRCALCFRP